MADPSNAERHVEPTARRIAEARSHGQVAISRDLSLGVVALVVWVTLVMGGTATVGGLAIFMRDVLKHAANETHLRGAIRAGLTETVAALGLLLAGAVAAALAVGLAQSQGLLTIVPLRPDGRRLAPQLGRVWRAGRLGFGCKGAVVVVALLVVAAAAGWANARAIFGLAGADAGRLLDAIFALARSIGLPLVTTMLGLGVLDYAWQTYRRGKVLRMSSHEAKREEREAEGDPVFRAERRSIHWELSQAHALAALVESDLVVVEPGRVFVALRWAADPEEAPFVAAKGKDSLAQRMEAIAAASRVPIVVDPLLAARLASSEVGEAIPEALYEKVAGLLAEAWSCGHRHSRRSENGTIRGGQWS